MSTILQGSVAAPESHSGGFVQQTLKSFGRRLAMSALAVREPKSFDPAGWRDGLNMGAEPTEKTTVLK